MSEPAMEAQAAAEAPKRGHKQEKVGVVVSTKMRKTIVVEVERRAPHPLYKKVVARRKKFYAHDEEEVARAGDVVRIVESRPLSRLKRWRLVEVIRRAALPEMVEPVEPTEELTS
jgi:small subunit ribosomal protein S17